ncbi:Plasmodium exported protein (PHIST), unknown function [Plasmodium relictum]|uniref:Plasmodium RESA N-terminal domain-containing protein n=1 Tax=Plasmodium relictum TaxID=85471 RepID=A0A1J1GPK9_PLARL|nr:Plasmodium exported protein (PHIST), unknown function [Plasmodium relictum]CRG85805.1 Plasmodium exported protein (PHIST), unknown function [Plasmodium relictum]
MGFSNTLNLFLKRRFLASNNTNVKNEFVSSLNRKGKNFQKRNFSNFAFSKLFIYFCLSLFYLLLLNICISKRNIISDLQLSNGYSRKLTECICKKKKKKSVQLRSSCSNSVCLEENGQGEKSDDEVNGQSKEGEEEEEEEVNSQSKEEEEEEEEEVNSQSKKEEEEEVNSQSKKEEEKEVNSQSKEEEDEVNGQSKEGEDDIDTESGKVNSQKKNNKEKNSELFEQLSEEEIDEMLDGLDDIPNIQDVYILWWQHRGSQRNYFLDLMSELSDLYNSLVDMYNYNKKNLEKEWKKWYLGLLKDLTDKETEDNKTFYSLTNQGGLTREGLGSFINENKEEWKDHKENTRNKWKDIITTDFMKKK